MERERTVPVISDQKLMYVNDTVPDGVANGVGPDKFVALSPVAEIFELDTLIALLKYCTPALLIEDANTA